MIPALLMAVGAITLFALVVIGISLGFLRAMTWLERRGHGPRPLRVDDVTLARLRREDRTGEPS